MSEAFLNEVRYIEDEIRNFDSSVKGISQLQRRALSATSSQEEKRIAARLNEVVRDTNNAANKIRNRLHGLKERVRPGAGDYQLRKNNLDKLARNFMDALSRYQKLQSEHQAKQQDKIKRQYLIANPHASEEELRNAMESEESGPIFSQALINSKRSSEARRIYNEVEDRHQQVVKLAQSIEELATLFMDMQTMIETQDAMIVSIGDQVEKTERSTEHAAKEMTEAVIQKRTANRKCKILALCIFILIIVVLIVIFFAPLFGPPLITQIIQNSKGGNASNNTSTSGANGNTQPQGITQ